MALFQRPLMVIHSHHLKVGQVFQLYNTTMMFKVIENSDRKELKVLDINTKEVGWLPHDFQAIVIGSVLSKNYNRKRTQFRYERT